MLFFFSKVQLFLAFFLSAEPKATHPKTTSKTNNNNNNNNNNNSYMFLRLGRLGYQQVLGDCWRVASALADMLASTGAFDVVSPRAPVPGVALVAFRLAASRRGRGYDEHDVSDGLRERGWIVPAYPLPAGTEEVEGEPGTAPVVLRVVCRADLSFGLAATLASDVARALDRLEEREAKDRAEAVAARATQAWKSSRNKARAKRRLAAAEASRQAEELKERAEASAAAKSASAADLASKAAEKGAEAAAAAAAEAAVQPAMRHGGVC